MLREIRIPAHRLPKPQQEIRGARFLQPFSPPSQGYNQVKESWGLRDPAQDKVLHSDRLVTIPVDHRASVKLG